MATQRGAAETNQLQQNVEEQLSRLVTQLQDLEENREELDDDEYEEFKSDTVDQLKEFQAQLDKMSEGNMTLVDRFGAVQLAIQAAISSAFKAPEVIRLFAKRDNSSLRDRLGALQTQQKLGKISEDQYRAQVCEVLVALKKLGDKISAQEEAFLAAHRSEAVSNFDTATNELGSDAKAAIESTASAQNQRAGISN